MCGNDAGGSTSGCYRDLLGLVEVEIVASRQVRRQQGGVVMVRLAGLANAKHLRLRAEECHLRATRSSDPDVRMEWKDLASEWHLLAAKLEEDLLTGEELIDCDPAKAGDTGRFSNLNDWGTSYASLDAKRRK